MRLRPSYPRIRTPKPARTKITLMGEEHVFDFHASEGAALLRSARSGPQPGSIEERDALAAIDEARQEDLYPQSRATMRRQQRRYWSDREHALGH